MMDMPAQWSQRNGMRVEIGLAVLGLVTGLGLRAGCGFPFGDPRAVGAAMEPGWNLSADESARQVTVFAILATPDSTAVDSRLDTIKTQLRKALPDHGFKLIDVQSKRLEAKQSVTCDLSNGYKAEIVLVRLLDENGKVQLRCNLGLNGTRQFSTLVKTPVNQLFFYERSLKDGTRVLIGVGAR
jgi:hypothetical protein